MKPKIIHEDESLIVINKPSGFITNEASTTTNQPVVQSWIKENLEFEISKSKEFRSGIVHRLDKETSGILLIAKTKKAFKNLQSQFKERIVKKEYTALAHGRIEPGEGIVKVPVGRLPWKRDRFGVVPGGRDSETSYKVKDYYKKESEEYSLTQLKPITGRTHQIRIHLKYLGHPIVSDEFYAGRKTARDDRVWCPRLFLHASKIFINHPEKNEKISFESKVSQDLQKALSSLEREG